MRHDMEPVAASRSPQTEQEVDAQVGVHLAAQLRELLHAQPLDESLARVLPGLVGVLRHGIAAAPVTSLFPELLESSWSSLLRLELTSGVRVDAVPAFLDALLLAHAPLPPAAISASGAGAFACGDAAGAPHPLTCEAYFQAFTPKSSHGLCGYLFQRNDISFNCRTCQLDETCVLCLKCYQNGNHEGHDIYFHRTAPGGMCDCGDPEAWDPRGFCVYHGQQPDGDGDATPPLPQEILGAADVLFEDIINFLVEMAKTTMDLFDPERVERMGRQLLDAYSAQHGGINVGGVGFGPGAGPGAGGPMVGGLLDAANGSPTQRAILSAMAPRFHVRICNDDVHSDEDLITSLSKKRIPDARKLVRAIDSNGSELVATNLVLRDALALMQQLRAEGWHVCVVHDRFIHDEHILVRVIEWVKAICTMSPPLLRMFCAKLFDKENPRSAPKEPIQIMFLSDPYFRKEIVVVLYELYLKLQSEKDPKLDFSLVFLKVYNRLMVKYFCGIGTKDESLFQYGVQIFTTPSIVNHLANLGLLDIMLETINTALDLAKTSTPTGATMLAARAASAHTASGMLTRTLDCDHSILKFKRYAYVLDNFGYVMNVPTLSSDLLLQREHLRKWFWALQQMQGLDPQTRIQDGHAHVTYETQLWFSAFNFHSFISRLATILSKGLRQHVGSVAEKSVMVQNVFSCFWEQLEHAGGIESGIAIHSPTFGFGVRPPSIDDWIIKYDVASQPVSFHYPLHGFLSNFLLESMYYGPEVADWKTFVEDALQAVGDGEEMSDPELLCRRKKLLLYGMLEFPLRTLVLCAQIQSGLWIRNGQSMHRQMLHYTNPPLCSELRDLDLFLIQISASVLGFSKFLSVFFDRFGLMEWLHSWSPVRRGESDRDGGEATFTMGEEKLVSLLEGALLQIIWIITELPPPRADIDERDIWLRREIVHRLAQQPCRLSELLDQTGFMTSTPFGGVSSPQGDEHLARLEAILEDVADTQVKRGGSFTSAAMSGDDDAASGQDGMEPTKYVLKKEFYCEYDPSFYHLARSAHEKAQFARQEALFKSWKPEDMPIPLVDQIPPAHPSFASLRWLVCERGLLGIFRLILEDATSDSPSKKTNVMVTLRTIHLMNLVVLVLRRHPISTEHPTPVIETKKRRVLALLCSGPDAFEENESSVRGAKRFKRQKPKSSGDGEGDISMSSDSDQGEVAEVEDLSIVALLATLAKDQIKHDFETSKSTISAIYWILKQLALMDSNIAAFVEASVGQGVKKSQDHAHAHGLSKAELKKLHQQRAIEAMMAKQKAFASSAMFAEMDEEDDEHDGGIDEGADSIMGTTALAGTTVVYRPPPPPECIICTQKKRHEPVMYIGHAQTSQVNTHAVQEKPFSSAPLSETFPPHMYLSLCGHAVHLQCWKKYFDSVRAQSRFNLEHSQSNIAFDAHFGEFLCPLCQSLSSMLVPYVAPSGTLTLDDQQRNRDAMERVFQSKQDTASILSWLTSGLPTVLAQCEDEEDNFESDGMIAASDDAEGDIDSFSGPFEGNGRNDGRRAVGTSGGSSSLIVDDDVRAMKQFAISFLEALARFQPELTHVAATIAALKKSFFSTGPQLAHLIWSAVASTCASAQLSGISSAIYALEATNSPTEQFLARKRLSRRTSPISKSASDLSPGAASTSSTNSAASTSFSSLRITSILNPPLPSLRSRLAVSLPEALEQQLDPFSPKDDGKLNCLLRALRRAHVLFKNRKQDFHRAICVPIEQALRLEPQAEDWMTALSCGAPLHLGQPILSQDLFYLCVAICGSVLHSKADILLTVRSLCVLHIAQVLLQIARMNGEDSDEDEDEDEDEGSLADGGDGDAEAMDAEANRDASGDVYKSRRLTRQERETARHLADLMDRLSSCAGVDLVAIAERDGAPYAPPRGAQLLYLFEASSLTFLRQVTLLLRGVFRGEQDPDAAHYANFVSSLRLSTDFHTMTQQLGLPTIDGILADGELVRYLEQAAGQLRTSRLACIPDEIQYEYRQHGHVEGVLQAVDELLLLRPPPSPVTMIDPEAADALNVILRNLNQLPALPIRCLEDANGNRQFYYANVRLVRLAPLYTDLHSEVLARSRCPITHKIVENPAICLVCEQVLCAGTDCCRRASDGMGACTAHAIACGYGVGLFFLMRSSSVLLVFGPRSSYFGSPYLDMFGEEDINLRRGRPLYLNSKRMKALLSLYANHQLANEVARNRRTSDQYIRNNYY